MTALNRIINVTVQNASQKINVERKNILCMCKSLKLFFTIGKYAGLLPITPYNQENHTNKCLFKISKWGLSITITYLILFVPYVFYMYGKRIICGSSSSTLNQLEWYVMTFGYIIIDVESILSLFHSLVTIKNVCNLFEEISIEKSPLNIKKYIKIITISLAVMVLALLLFFSSYVYVAWLRMGLSFGHYDCTLLDQPFAVIIRGLTLIFPFTNTLIILVLSRIIVNKFNNISEDLPNALQSLILTESSKDIENIAKRYETTTSLINKINKYYGVQLLMGLASSLYTTIYYLYRFTTATNSDRYTVSSSHEKMHYLLGIIFRSSKIVIYTIMGNSILNSANKPKEIISRCSILSSPRFFQEKIQLLLLIWQDKKITLSSMGVVNIGPWLLGPILGNVITYLLVALQFKTSGMENPGNDTAFMEFLF